MLQQIEDTVSFIRDNTNLEPRVGIILGTGLGGLVDEIEIHTSLHYENIPNFPVSTVEGHSGSLIFGILNDVPIVAMQGRFHYYEGYDMKTLTFPVRVLKALGISYLFLSNASGGVNPEFEIGDLMLIRDHINLMPNPLLGKNYNELGPRFPDMSQAYDKNLLEKAKHIAMDLNITLQEGVYTATSGPTFETPSEYMYFRIIGSDTVGMSTVPEVIVARHMGIPCFAISIITDLGVPGKIVEISHEEVQKVAAKAEKKMTQLMKSMMHGL
jgi:purine-nucleoside phosphorylase